MRCCCGALDCPSCGPAQGWHVHSRHCADADGYYDCGQHAYGDDDAPAETDEEEPA